jgi:hypothetical protein
MTEQLNLCFVIYQQRRSVIFRVIASIFKEKLRHAVASFSAALKVRLNGN